MLTPRSLGTQQVGSDPGLPPPCPNPAPGCGAVPSTSAVPHKRCRQEPGARPEGIKASPAHKVADGSLRSQREPGSPQSPRAGSPVSARPRPQPGRAREAARHPHLARTCSAPNPRPGSPLHGTLSVTGPSVSQDLVPNTPQWPDRKASIGKGGCWGQWAPWTQLPHQTVQLRWS